MSTLIYDGTIIVPTPTLAQLDDLFDAYSKKARAACQEVIDALYVARATSLHDFRLLDLEKGNPKTAERDAMVELLFKEIPQALKSLERTGIYDLGCEIAAQVAKDGSVLARVFAEHEFYKAIWREMPGVEPYGYWDNSDKPDDIDDEAWKKRKEDWQGRHEGTPDKMAHRGFTRTVVDEYSLPTQILNSRGRLRAALRHEASVADRAMAAAEAIILAEREGPDGEATTTWRKIQEEKAFVASPEGRSKIEARRKIVEPLIAANDPFADLKARFPEEAIKVEGQS